MIIGPKNTDFLVGTGQAATVNHAIKKVDNQLDKAVDMISPGPGWGDLIQNRTGNRHEAFLPALLPLLGLGAGEAGLGTAAAGMAARAAGGAALHGLAGSAADAADDFEAGDGWGDLVQHTGSYRPAGLSDRYIDITAEFDYHNDPVAQFRHDPDAYINRIGHLMDEGLNPRFAEYMELVEADRNIRTAAWKDVRKKALRLKREGHVTVKDMSPSSIMASVVGDHGTYDVTVLKGASLNGITSNQIANWHCACEWGRWAFRRKYTYVGRLCSHAYASYLTMQSAALKGKKRPRRPGPTDTIIVNRPARDRELPSFVFAAGRRQADALQNGPDRLTPDMVVNDTDDAHIFLDVTKDERKDVGPDDVVSDKDIVHFARLMRHCEATEQPYPRQLVSFLARYAGTTDDRPTDYVAPDTEDAIPALNKLRNFADQGQEQDFGDMADRVHRIQDAVEDARDNGVDASQFVAAVRKIADPTTKPNGAPDGYEAVPGGAKGTQLYREKADGKSIPEAWGADRGNRGIEVGPNGNRQVSFDGGGSQGPANGKFNYDGGAYGGATGLADPQGFADSFSGKAPDTKTVPSSPYGSSDPQAFTKSWPNQPMPDRSNTGQQSGSPGEKGVGATGKPAVAPTPGASNAGNPGTGGTPGTGGKGGDGGGAGGAGRPMTQGPISDGGVAGAENGNNAAIGKDQLDGDGYYTVQKGDTLSDIAQRSYGDMNKYQDLAKGNNIANPDVINEGQRIKIDNPTGNGGMAGDVTNPGGSSKAMAGPAADTSAVAPPANPAMSTPGDTGTAGNTGAGVPSSESLNANSALTSPGLNNPPAPAQAPAAPLAAEAGGTKVEGRRRLSAPTTPADPNAGQDGQTNTTAPTTTAPKPAAPASTSTTPVAKPGGTDSPKAVGPNKDSDTYDPNDPAQSQQPVTGTSPMTPGGGMSGMDGLGQALGAGADIASGLGRAIPDIASGIGSALPGMASGIGDAVSGIASGLGSIFASRQDFDDWVRYAYPTADGEGDLQPHDHPFAGSGYPGPLEIGTSEDYADKARKKHDDVTDLGDEPLSTPMGKWQRQSALDDEDDDSDYRDGVSEMHGKPWKGDWQGMMAPGDDGDHGNHHKSGSFDPNDDSSDIVRTFQAHIGETALGTGAGGGGGRFDDFASAAQGFLRTAGRNYSLAEQSELIREGDKGGAGNLRSLDLTGTHYEDMDSLGW